MDTLPDTDRRVEPLWPELDEPEVPYTVTVDLELPPGDAGAGHLERFVAGVRAFERLAQLEESLIVITPVARAQVTVPGRSGPRAMESVLAAGGGIAGDWLRVRAPRGELPPPPARA